MLIKKNIEIDGYKCERCFHEWIPRAKAPAIPPICCPKCKSPYWNIPRKLKKENADITQVLNGIN